MSEERGKSQEISSATRLIDEGEIARGGMGSIRRMLDPTLCRPVAMKLFDPERAQTDQQAARRFVQEGQITGQLDHPNVVPVYQLVVDEHGHPSFFTMKLVHGETLTELFDARDLERPSERDLERLLRVIIKVCEAVSFAHSRGVVHRDLKPDNVMVGTHGQVYVMDWGCARLVPGAERWPVAVRLPDPTDEPTGLVIGTTSYMAPEQALGLVGEIDARTDVFALGAILYRLLTKRPIYRAPHYAMVLALAQRGDVQPPQQVVPAGTYVPAELSRIAMRALAADKARRYQSVDELKQELEAFLRGGSWLAMRVYPAGSTIVSEGDPGDEAYIITGGRCEAVKFDDGKKTTLRVMGPGSVFGETAILTAQPRTATVIALEELSVLVVSREALEHELCFDSWTGAFVRALAERFRDLDQQLSEVRRAANEARLVQWTRDFLITAGTPVGDGTWEAPWIQVAAAMREDLGHDEETLIGALERSREVKLHRERGVVSLFSAGGAAGRAWVRRGR